MEPRFDMTEEQFRNFLFDCVIDLFATVNTYGELVRKMRAEQRRVDEAQVMAEVEDAKEKYRIDLAAHYLSRHSQ